MAQITVDIGPAAAQALTVGVAAVANIGVSIIDRPGPVRLAGNFTVNNPAASTPTVTAALRKNGLQIAATVRTLIMAASTRVPIHVEHVDLAAAVGDVYTMEIATSAAVAGHELTVNQSSLTVQALTQNAAVIAGIGPPTA
jgi:cytochrome P450